MKINDFFLKLVDRFSRVSIRILKKEIIFLTSEPI